MIGLGCCSPSLGWGHRIASLFLSTIKPPRTAEKSPLWLALHVYSKYTCMCTLPLKFFPSTRRGRISLRIERLIISQTEGKCIFLEISYIVHNTRQQQKGRMADQTDLVPQKNICNQPVTSPSSVPSRPSHPPSPNFLADRRKSPFNKSTPAPLTLPSPHHPPDDLNSMYIGEVPAPPFRWQQASPGIPNTTEKLRNSR
jgi:hypothetical protein